MKNRLLTGSQPSDQKIVKEAVGDGLALGEDEILLRVVMTN